MLVSRSRESFLTDAVVANAADATAATGAPFAQGTGSLTLPEGLTPAEVEIMNSTFRQLIAARSAGAAPQGDERSQESEQEHPVVKEEVKEEEGD